MSNADYDNDDTEKKKVQDQVIKTLSETSKFPILR